MSTLDEPTPAETSPANAAAPDGTPPARRSGMTIEDLAVSGFILGIFAVAVAVFAVGFALRAIDEANAGRDAATAAAAPRGSEANTTDVSLKDFAIDPDELSIAAGSTLNLSNDGAVVHNLAVEQVASAMIDAGGTGELDLRDLPPGTYTMICEVPGHEAAGMTGTLTIE